MLFDPQDPNITQDEVETIRKAAKCTLMRGGLYISEYETGNTSVKKAFAIPARILMKETLYYLKVVDPDTYGYVVTRTRPNFYTWY